MFIIIVENKLKYTKNYRTCCDSVNLVKGNFLGPFGEIWKRIKCFPPLLRRRNSKTQQILSVHTTAEKFENTTITGHFGFVWGKLGQENHMILAMSSFLKSSVFKTFSGHTKTKSRDFKFLRFEERFRKAPFSWRISADDRFNDRKKTAV